MPGRRGYENPRLDMFNVPPTDLIMSSRRVVRINPFNTGIHPVTFQVDRQEDFIDLNESFFEVEWTVKTAAGANLAQATLIGLVNNLAHTLFKQINVRLNGTLISPQTDTYHYKSYIEALLNHDRDDGETILTPHGWYNCLSVPSPGDADVMTANKLDPAHADYAALPQDFKNMVQSRIQFFWWKEGDFEVQTLPGSVSSKQVTGTWCSDPDRHVLQCPSSVDRPMGRC